MELGGTIPQLAAERFARIDVATRQGYSRPSPAPAYANGFHLRPETEIPVGERIDREKEIFRRAGFGSFVIPRFSSGPPSREEIHDVLLQTKGYPGIVTVAGSFVPVHDE